MRRIQSERRASAESAHVELVLDHVRFRAMTPAERRAVLGGMARLLLEAGDVAATRGVSDDNA